MSYISSRASQADVSDGVEDGVINLSFYRNHTVYISLDKKMIGITTDLNELRVGETYCIVVQQDKKGKRKVLFDAAYAENLWSKLSKNPEAQTNPFTFVGAPQVSLEPGSISMVSCLCISGANGKQLLCSVASGFPGKE
jgi:hypothetical protein